MSAANNIVFLINELPPYNGNYKSIRKRQSISDLMNDILYKHEKNAIDCDKIAKYFWRGNALNTAKFLFDFCRGNIRYKEENTDSQTVKSIAGILVEGQGDCKHYSQFIVGICSALQRMGYPIKAKYRFAVYNAQPNSDGVRSGHVFAVIMDRGQELWCDPVLKTFNQRNPRYISHEDKTPPEPVIQAARLGQVWDVSGVGNSTTLSGPRHHAGGGGRGFHGGGFRGRGGYYGGRPTYIEQVYTPPEVIYEPYVPTYEEQLALQQKAMFSGIDNEDTLSGHRGRNLFRRFMNSPLSPLHPGISTEHLRKPKFLNGITITHDDRGTLMEQPASDRVGYVDDFFNRDTLGKAKKAKAPKKKHEGLKKLKDKLKHIKVQPGKLLKKVGGAPSRNAFLALLKINAFHLGSQIYEKASKNPDFKKKLYETWEKKLGGNGNKLSTALTQAKNVWNKHHAAHKIAGAAPWTIEGQHLSDHDAQVGVAPVAIPALLAAATPIIMAVKNLLKSFGIKAPQKGDIDQAEQDTIDAHNNATSSKGDGNADINEDGSVDHGNGVVTKVSVDPQTGKQTLSYEAEDSDNDGDKVVKTKTKTITKEESVDEDGEEVETTTKTKSISKTGSTGIGAFWDNTKMFVVEHKKWFIGGGLVIVGLIVIPKVYRAMSGPKKRRR